MKLEPRVILVVDDDDAIREALGEVLARSDREVVLAHDGQQAIDLVEGGVRPCVVLLDWMMPRVSGDAFLMSRATSSELRDVPVYVASASHVPHDDRIQAVLPKPLELDDLLSVIASTCDVHCKRRASCPLAKQADDVPAP
jgi:CheY-like chemotaxis protein